METISREVETEQTISNLLKISIESFNVAVQLKRILKILTDISWFKLESKGAIFLIGSKNNLVMVAQQSLGPEIRTRCERVKFGECLCGKAAQQKEVIFRSCVDEDHHIRYDGMKAHGHYNIPLINDNALIGVIVLYMPHGHKQDRHEKIFVKMLGDVVANIIAKDYLEKRTEVTLHELRESQADMISRLLTAAECRDNETGKHIKRMTNYSLVIGKQKGLTQRQLDHMEHGAPLHDIGKIGISDTILLKPGSLTSEEFDIMKQHTIIGAKILTGRSKYLAIANEIALSHHEKWDGSGYPFGKKGLEIPLNGRICAIADVFDALTTKRVYKEPWSIDAAFEFINNQAGRQFDPELVEIFCSSRKEIISLQAIYGDDIIELNRKLIPSYEKNITGKIKWSSDLTVGIDIIDEHHRYLITLINDIYISNLQGKKIGYIVSTITKMTEYADIHFEEEEKFMRNCRYPRLQEQIKQHTFFLSECENFLQNLKKYSLTIGFEIVLFLKAWLIRHIKEEDTRIRKWADAQPN